MMKKYIFTLTLIALWGLFAPSLHAARVNFEAESTVGTGSAFSIDITLDANLPVNAITLVIPLPESVDLVGVSDANSIVNMWVEKPRLNEKHELVLSGLIPGGYGAQGGKIATMFLQAARPGSLSIGIGPGTNAYLHSENGTEEAVTARTIQLTLVEGQTNTISAVEDTIPPEEFVPVYAELPQGDTTVWAVGFATQDKGSGVKEYYVAESRKNIDPNKSEKITTLNWRLAESPATLEDQSLKSYIYVKAVDINGNVRIAQLAPAAKWYERPIGYILMGVLLIGVIYAIFLRKNKSKRKF
jgi:hypothetical protein